MCQVKLVVHGKVKSSSWLRVGLWMGSKRAKVGSSIYTGSRPKLKPQVNQLALDQPWLNTFVSLAAGLWVITQVLSGQQTINSIYEMSFSVWTYLLKNCNQHNCFCSLFNFWWGVCLKFTSHIILIWYPNAFKTNKIKKTCPNVYFSMLSLYSLVFQRNKNMREIEKNDTKLCKIIFLN